MKNNLDLHQSLIMYNLYSYMFGLYMAQLL